MGNKRLSLIHSIIYNIGWFACILGAAYGDAWIGPLIVTAGVIFLFAWQHYVEKSSVKLFTYLLIITLMGLVVDTALMHAGAIQFHANPFSPYLSPPWMMALWLSFATFFYAMLKPLHKRYWVMSCLALIFMPLAYYAGAKLGAAVLVHGWRSTLLVGVCYAISFPIVLRLLPKIN